MRSLSSEKRKEEEVEQSLQGGERRGRVAVVLLTLICPSHPFSHLHPFLNQYTIISMPACCGLCWGASVFWGTLIHEHAYTIGLALAGGMSLRLLGGQNSEGWHPDRGAKKDSRKGALPDVAQWLVLPC